MESSDEESSQGDDYGYAEDTKSESSFAGTESSGSDIESSGSEIESSGSDIESSGSGIESSGSEPEEQAEVSQGDSIILYHYTSVENAENIDEEKSILASDPDGPDARYGEGVYLTAYGPERGKAFLTYNNWGGRKILREKLEAYVEIEMPEDDPQLTDVSEGVRNIFLYRGNIDLNNYDHEIREF